MSADQPRAQLALPNDADLDCDIGGNIITAGAWHEDQKLDPT